MTFPLLELGGAGPLIHLAPANGFPPASYLPMLAPLSASHRVVSLPPRALWDDTGRPPDQPGDWSSLADDLLEGIRQYDLPPLIAIGHSFGAVASMLAAVREPARFRALALLDPTILPPALMDTARTHRLRGETSLHPLVQGARKRRDRFESPEEAFAYWREKPLFADWSDAAVWRYVRAMLRPKTGGGFTLTWSPLWEAYYYESFHDRTWDDIAGLAPALPLFIMGGATSTTFLPEAVALLRERLPHATHHSLPGYGHLFPLAAPAETGRILATWLATLPDASGSGPPPR